jgi:hypothetical protein
LPIFTIIDRPAQQPGTYAFFEFANVQLVTIWLIASAI